MSGADFKTLMVPVATAILGEPNATLSTRAEIRWGTRGSFAVNLQKGTWFDHEAGDQGGGVLDFLKVRKGFEKPDAILWLEEKELIEPSTKTKNGRGKIVKTYPYVDEAGTLLFEVVRFEPKDFRQRRPDPNKPGGWIWNMSGVRKVIYRLPQVLDAIRAGRAIYICEGEKAVDALVSIGVDATCSPGGAGKWQPAYGDALRGAKSITVLPDNDEPGRRHAVDVHDKMHRRINHRPKILKLPGLPEKGDAADWVAAGGTAEKLKEFPMLLLRAAMGRDDEDTFDNVKGVHSEAPKPLNVNNINVEGIEAQTEEPEPGVVTLDNIQGEAGDAPAEPAPEQPAKPAAPDETTAKIDAAVAAVLREFNAKYMVVNENGKATIYQPGFDRALNRRHYTRLSPSDLKILYLNRLVPCGVDQNDKALYKPASEVWLRHRERRQFIDGVTFDPSTTEPKPGILNLWQGFAVKPKRGDWSLLRDHVFTVICDGNRGHFNYLMGYMARMVQHPDKQGEVAVVLKGGEGTGKGTLARALLRIMGQHGMAISNAKHLIGNFNGHLRDAVFLFADEAFFAGDRQHVGVLKSLVTEPYLTIEAKFQNADQMANYLHVMMASNEEWVVPASIDARRFFVLVVSEARKGDHEYFGKIWNQMETGGYEAMLHELLDIDLTGFNVRAVPTTEGLQQQRKLSLPVPQAWWQDVLGRGYVFRSRLGLEATFGQWHEVVSTELLFASYSEFAAGKRERHPMSREQLGEFMGRMGCARIRPRSGIVGEHIVDEPTTFGSHRVAKAIPKERPPSYSIGKLEVARAGFSEALGGLAMEWETDDNFPAAAE